MVNIAILAIPYLVFVIFLELEIHRNDIPRSDTPNQVGQWGPWVISVLVAMFTIFLQLIGYSPWPAPETPDPTSSIHNSEQQPLQPQQSGQDPQNPQQPDPDPAHIPSGGMDQEQQHEFQLREYATRQRNIELEYSRYYKARYGVSLR